MEQLLNGMSCAPACPIQLPGGFAENSGRLVALMTERGEGKCQADGGRRQAIAGDPQAAQGWKELGTDHLFPIYSPLSKDKHSRTPCFPHSLRARRSWGLG